MYGREWEIQGCNTYSWQTLESLGESYNIFDPESELDFVYWPYIFASSSFIIDVICQTIKEILF